MNILNLFKVSLRAIANNKMRSFLSMLGIIIGVAAVIIMMAIGQGSKESIRAELSTMGTNLLTIRPGADMRGGVRQDPSAMQTLKQADYERIMREKKYVTNVSPEVTSSGQVIYGNNNTTTSLYGESPEYLDIKLWTIEQGDCFTEEDVHKAAKVCVIGNQVAKTLFPDDESPVGQSINIAGTSYDVVGVTKKTNDMVNLGPHESKSVFLPITTAQYVFNAVGQADRMFLVLDDKYPSGEYYKPIDAVIRQRHQIHPDDDVALMSSDLKSQLNQFDIMIGGINALVWLVGLGTLLAGLIGISNIMMITVKERTQEIGVRRALGAEPWTIIKQIMCESLMLTLAAGIVGIIAGVWGLYAVNRMTAASMGDGGFFTNPHVPFVPAIAALIILIIGGLFAGFVPAKRAMAIKAIEALREE